jgi:hypothetical protein
MTDPAYGTLLQFQIGAVLEITLSFAPSLARRDGH